MIRRLSALPLAFALALVGTAGSAQASPDAAITEFRTPTRGSLPWGIATGPDGNLWFAERDASRIGRSTPAGQIVEFPLPEANFPHDITAGPDGAMWFTLEYPAAVGRISMDGEITEFPLPTGSDAEGITTGPDGNLWFVETYGNRVAKLTPDGTLTEYAVPEASSYPQDITTGPDGAMWFTASGVWRMTLDGRMHFLYAGDTGEEWITPGPDGALWFTDVQAIGRVTTDGHVSVFRDRLVRLPVEVTTGADGALWFTVQIGSKIGRLAPGGGFRFVDTPTRQAYPTGIELGPDGKIWFTENGKDRIGRVNVS